MNTLARDVYLVRFEKIIKITSIILEVICFGVSFYFFLNSGDKPNFIFIGLAFLLGAPLIIWLMYETVMVVISFFYDVKMIRNRLKVIEERSRVKTNNALSEEKK